MTKYLEHKSEDKHLIYFQVGNSVVCLGLYRYEADAYSNEACSEIYISVNDDYLANEEILGEDSRIKLIRESLKAFNKLREAYKSELVQASIDINRKGLVKLVKRLGFTYRPRDQKTATGNNIEVIL